MLRNKLLEGGLEYNIFEKKKDEEISLEGLVNQELSVMVNIKDNRESTENQFLKGFIHKQLPIH